MKCWINTSEQIEDIKTTVQQDLSAKHYFYGIIIQSFEDDAQFEQLSQNILKHSQKQGFKCQIASQKILFQVLSGSLPKVLKLIDFLTTEQDILKFSLSFILNDLELFQNDLEDICRCITTEPSRSSLSSARQRAWTIDKTFPNELLFKEMYRFLRCCDAFILQLQFIVETDDQLVDIIDQMELISMIQSDTCAEVRQSIRCNKQFLIDLNQNSVLPLENVSLNNNFAVFVDIQLSEKQIMDVKRFVDFGRFLSSSFVLFIDKI